MIPVNARCGDLVVVSNTDSDYFGAIGRIELLFTKEVNIDFYGKVIRLPKEDLTLKARKGTITHDFLSQQIKEHDSSSLAVEDYNSLVNFAIDSNDFDWARELISRRDKLSTK